METENTLCLECDTEIKGRSDKRFCGDCCRTNYNNRKRQADAAIEPEFLKKIPKIILNNYHILQQLNTSGPTTVKRSQLESMGFNFSYITSFYTTKGGDHYQFCFDQGYLHLRDDRVLLVTQQSQVII